jgi:hypothetical protein
MLKHFILVPSKMESFTVVSDVHLEFGVVDPPKTEAKVLVIAGDLCPIVEFRKFEAYIEKACSMYEHVLYVTGNHEYYGSSPARANPAIVRLATYNKKRNFHFLDCETVLGFDDIGVYGGTAWTALNNPMSEMHVQRGMNDFWIIEDFSVQKWKEAHAKFVEGLEGFMTENFVKRMVISHHAPCHKSVHDQYKHHYNDMLMNDAYYTELSGHFDDTIKFWLHGHTHHSFDYMVENTRVICNPRGYFPRHLNEEYNENLVIHV